MYKYTRVFTIIRVLNVSKFDSIKNEIEDLLLPVSKNCEILLNKPTQNHRNIGIQNDQTK